MNVEKTLYSQKKKKKNTLFTKANELIFISCFKTNINTLRIFFLVNDINDTCV